ncbi:hypothetical protein BKA62DRAFT_771322 [Auriculariales sp. MPI-PUGE-AT-0066]|nr:hypothetical protein BKA62DRAFT_771322 [Auriculariales sp. MPI-PUGE-AT-0066]
MAPPPPPKQSSRHSMFYADLATLAPIFVLACGTYLGLKVVRETCLMYKNEVEAKEQMGELEHQLNQLVNSNQTAPK